MCRHRTTDALVWIPTVDILKFVRYVPLIVFMNVTKRYATYFNPAVDGDAILARYRTPEPKVLFAISATAAARAEYQAPEFGANNEESRLSIYCLVENKIQRSSSFANFLTTLVPICIHCSRTISMPAGSANSISSWMPGNQSSSPCTKVTLVMNS